MGGKVNGKGLVTPKALVTKSSATLAKPLVSVVEPMPLANGRQLRIQPGTQTEGDHLQILSPSGDIEVEIVLTVNGPVVRVRGGDLQLSASRSIELQAEGAVRIQAEELRVLTSKSVHLNGETIRLNCDDDGNPQSHRLPQASPLTKPASNLVGGCSGDNHHH